MWLCSGWNANPFDRQTQSTRYNPLPNYMWDHIVLGGNCCADKVGCVSPPA
jgi:hypothetical protein